MPGAVDGWLELHKKYGTKELGRLRRDAVHIARDGFPISQEFVESIDEFSPSFPGSIAFIASPSARRNRARFLCKKVWPMCSKKSPRKGRDGFYGGEVADKICATIKAEGGILAPEDLRRVVSQWLEPLQLDLSRHDGV